MTRIVAAVVTAMVAVVLPAGVAQAQEGDTPMTEPVAKPAFLFGAAWFSAVSIDVYSDHFAVAHVHAVEGNPIMPGDAQARYAVAYAGAAAGTWIATRLWRNDHKRLAVALTVSNIVIRGFVARHNFAVGSSEPATQR